MSSDRIHLTMSSRPTGEMSPYGFARVLDHSVRGVRYYDPPAPPPRGRRSMPLPQSSTAREFNANADAERAAAERYTRWTAEREQTMPTTRGKLTRTSVSSYPIARDRVMRGKPFKSQTWYVDVACACGQHMRVERSTWVSPERGPRQCIHCARDARRGRPGSAPPAPRVLLTASEPPPALEAPDSYAEAV